ncbi:MAG: uncharacterized protein JWO98_1689, partial [Frankiales bacterium]|nr:uncharacterized protein [Frankiales bacterium]
MPLRSVEAATRDDAIAAAREQFGPTARVVGVRRVRSGGVLGFFATERYVAEVDPDHPARAAGRERESARSSAVQASERAAAARRAEAEAARSGDRLNELTGLLGRDGAEPSVPTYSRSTVARSAPRDVPEAGAAEPAPFDAAWFDAFRAETARTASQRTETAQPTATRPASGRPTAPRSDAFRPEAARSEPFRSEPLRAEQSHPAAARSVQTRAGSARIEPARFQPARLEPEWAETPVTRTGFPRSSTAPEPEPAPVSSVRLRAGAVDAAPAPWSFAAAVLGETGATTVKDGDGDAPGTGESPPPSPFTAALARMVSGDRDVRQAVQAALDDRAAVRSANDDARPMRSRTAGSATTSAKTGAEHQKEEPVTEQDSGSPSLGAEVRPAGTPTWAAEAAPAAQSVSRREEAIAEVLRDALDQGHSDEALADILRKVLASTAPHVDLPVEPVEDPGLLVPAQPRSVTSPAVEESSWRGPSRPLWGDSEQASSSWSTVAADDVELPADAPIWAEVVLREPSPAEQRRDRAAEEAAAARAEEEAAAARAAEEAAAARAAARADEEAAAARAAEEA